MRVCLRAKAGQPLQMTDDNGRPIEGLIDFRLEPCEQGHVPRVALLIQGPQVVVDGVEASVTEQPPQPAGATGDGSQPAGGAGDGSQQ